MLYTKVNVLFSLLILWFLLGYYQKFFFHFEKVFKIWYAVKYDENAMVMLHIHFVNENDFLVDLQLTSYVSTVRTSGSELSI